MKIHFDNVNHGSTSGPNSFGKRLSEQFQKMGHEIVDSNSEYDIFLSFIQQTKEARPESKKILRLDGIWFKEENFEENNKSIKESYLSFDHVVFQSEFDKKMIETHFGECSSCSVIHNGIRITQRDSIKELTHAGEYIFVCSASWHRQKRLRENIFCFQAARKQLKEAGNEARFYILGRGASFDGVSAEELENVFYLNHQSHEECLRIYASADYFIHLAWLDHCPNVVVEALSQGCPIICTNSGGTQEIVKENGLIIQETNEYNYELTDYDKPYPIDLSNFSLPNEKIVVNSDFLEIEKVAKEYLKVFE